MNSVREYTNEYLQRTSAILTGVNRLLAEDMPDVSAAERFSTFMETMTPKWTMHDFRQFCKRNPEWEKTGVSATDVLEAMVFIAMVRGEKITRERDAWFEQAQSVLFHKQLMQLEVLNETTAVLERAVPGTDEHLKAVEKQKEAIEELSTRVHEQEAFKESYKDVRDYYDILMNIFQSSDSLTDEQVIEALRQECGVTLTLEQIQNILDFGNMAIEAVMRARFSSGA